LMDIKSCKILFKVGGGSVIKVISESNTFIGSEVEIE
jgi:hypothetical protein